jgi:hypothetical protein
MFNEFVENKLLCFAHTYIIYSTSLPVFCQYELAPAPPALSLSPTQIEALRFEKIESPAYYHTILDKSGKERVIFSIIVVTTNILFSFRHKSKTATHTTATGNTSNRFS